MNLRLLMFYIAILSIMPRAEMYGQDTWVRVFGGSLADEASAMVVGANENLYLAGSTYSTDGTFATRQAFGGRDIVLLKIDQSGNLLWVRSYGGSGDDVASDLAVLPDGGMVLCGDTRSSDGTFAGHAPQGFDAFVMRLDSNGTVVWRTVLRGGNTDNAFGLSLDDMGNAYICGRTASGDGDYKHNIGWWDIFAAKIDVDGNLLWVVTHGQEGIDYGMSISVYDDIVCIGGTESRGALLLYLDPLDGSRRDYFLAKGSSIDFIWDVALDSYGRTFACGDYAVGNELFPGQHKGGILDAFVLEYDLSTRGVVQSINLGGSGAESAQRLQICPSGSIFASGLTESNDGSFKGKSLGKNDVFLTKVSKSASESWVRTIGGSGDDVLAGFCVAKASIYVSGSTFSDDGAFAGMYRDNGDMFVVKLDSNGNFNSSTSVGASTSAPKSLSVSPNPVNSSSTVSFSLSIPSHVRIELVNALGQSIGVVSDGNMDPGQYTIPISTALIAPGVYSLRVFSEGEAQRVAIVVAK